jgi:hypothetical protein
MMLKGQFGIHLGLICVVRNSWLEVRENGLLVETSRRPIIESGNSRKLADKNGARPRRRYCKAVRVRDRSALAQGAAQADDSAPIPQKTPHHCQNPDP